MINDQIEDLLLNAQFAKEDLIEAYFLHQTSLDQVTKKAQELLKHHTDPKLRETICKNLSECIVVKNQRDKRSMKGFVKQLFSKIGIAQPKSKEILRAEILIKETTKKQKR